MLNHEPRLIAKRQNHRPSLISQTGPYSNIITDCAFQGGPEIGGIFVRNLLPGGAAEQSRSIHVGMSAIDFIARRISV